MRSFKLLLAATILMPFYFQMAKAQVIINEYSCANLKQFNDDFGKEEDWIELYNNNATAFDLSGYYLSDDTLNVMKYLIPAGTVIPGNGYRVFWASGRNSTATSSDIHTNFKLTQTKNSAERILLATPSGVVMDRVKIKKTKLGHSRGCAIDGDTTTFSIFTEPSPEAGNIIDSAYTAYANKPSVSHLPGHYPSAIAVTITNNEPTSSKIYYTTDGSLPSIASTLYTAPVNISTTTVLKAIAISDSANVLPGFVEFNTYFINVSHSLPIVSIASETLDELANGDKNYRPYGSIEYFDTLGVRKANSYGEFNSHGQDSWVHDQRSIDFVARDEMGYSNGIKEKLFKLSDRDKFQRVILRAAGDDNFPGNSTIGSAHLRDAYFQNICKAGGLQLDARLGSKAVVYLNGNYWGIYDLREIPDDHDYTDYYYGQDKYNIQYNLTWGTTWQEYGGPTAYADWAVLRNYVNNNDMSVASNYNYVESQLDVLSLIDYVISHSISVSSDWLNYNTGWWRGLNPNGGHQKWGYILWDNDASFDFYYNYTNIPSTDPDAPVCNVEDPQLDDPEDHVDLLIKLRESPEFDHLYISRYADLMNTTFSCDNMLHYLDSLSNLIAPEMPQQIARWGGTLNKWQTNVTKLRDFIVDRCGTKNNTGMQNCYNLTGPYDVKFVVTPAGAASMQVNSLIINASEWQASYFGGIDLNLNTTAYNTNAHQFNTWESQNGQTFNSIATTSLNAIQISQADTIFAKYDVLSGADNVFANKPYVKLYPTVTADNSTLEFNIAEQSPATIRMYDMMGKLVVDYSSIGDLSPGKYSIAINGTDLNLANGMYMVQYRSKSQTKTLKLVYEK